MNLHEIKNKNKNKSTTQVFLILAAMLCFLPGCRDTRDNGGADVMYNYTCENGTPKDGKSLIQNNNKCQACKSGYSLDGETCVSGHAYVCQNGTPEKGFTQTQNEKKCKACDRGYELTNARCIIPATYDYVCENGTRRDGMSLTENNNKCKACNEGYTLASEQCTQLTTYNYVCENGTRRDGMSLTENDNKCQACNEDHLLDTNTMNCIAEPTGMGTKESPYVLLNYTHLKNIANGLNKHYKLGANIDARASWGEGTEGCNDYNGNNALPGGTNPCTGWVPLARFATKTFKGSLDGNGYTISNLYVHVKVSTDSYRAGFLGFTNHSSEIKNLGLIDVYINLFSSFTRGVVLGGGLVGVSNGTITNSYATGSVVFSSTGSVPCGGGLVGFNDGTIVNSYAKVSVTISTSATTSGSFCGGGLVGENRKSIINSYATGEVTASADSLSSLNGGLVGFNQASASIINSYATGNVFSAGGGPNSIGGGLVGWNFSGKISNSYATGNAGCVAGQTCNGPLFGGLVGFNNGGKIRGTNYFVYNNGVGSGSCEGTCTQATGTDAAARRSWMRDTLDETTAFTTDSANTPAHFTAWDTAAWANLNMNGFPKLRYVEVAAFCSDSSRTSQTDCEADNPRGNPYGVWLATGTECEVITPSSSNTAANNGTQVPDCGDLISGQ